MNLWDLEAKIWTQGILAECERKGSFCYDVGENTLGKALKCMKFGLGRLVEGKEYDNIISQ